MIIHKKYGGASPPTTERRGAFFWCLPQHFAPFSLATDERSLRLFE